MKIHESSIWVDPAENAEWYQLSVINMWDWSTKSICFKNLDGHLISYCLYKYTTIDDAIYRKHAVTASELSQETKDQLEEMGYILNKK